MLDTANLLWQVSFYGRESMPATYPYFYDNRGRKPDSCVIQVVEAGQVLVRATDGTSHLASAGQAFLFRQGEDSTYGFPPNNTLPYLTQWLLLSGAGLAAHWDYLRTLNGPVIPATDGLLAGMRHLAELAAPRTRCSRPAMALAVHAFVMHLITSVGERHRQTQSPVERAIDDLVATPAAPWALKEVADKHGVSREHLTRAFLERIGTSPAAWLNQARVAKARHLLAQTDITLRDVAAQAGFASLHTMARLLKEATGLSPGNYRDQHRTSP